MSQVRKVGGILHWLPPTSKNRGGGKYPLCLPVPPPLFGRLYDTGDGKLTLENNSWSYMFLSSATAERSFSQQQALIEILTYDRLVDSGG